MEFTQLKAMSSWIYQVLAVATCCVIYVSSNSEKNFIRDQIATYERQGVEGRPVKNISEAVSVDVGFALIQILQFDQLEQHLTLTAWVTYQWNDAYFTWDAGEGPSEISLQSNEIWTPDIVLVNAVDEPINIHETKLQVQNDGHVTWVVQKKLALTCSTNPDEDEPSCELKFHSWSYGRNQLSLTAEKGRIDAGFYVPNHDWELSKTKADENSAVYPCCPDKHFSDLTFTFTLKRRPKEDDEEDKDKLAGASATTSSLVGTLAALSCAFLLTKS